MKKIISVLLLAALCLTMSAAFAEDAPKVVTIRSWLDSEGKETGLLVVQVQEILNPVWALVADETGVVNLFGVTVNGEFTDFFTAGITAGDLLMLWNPSYNEFEGTVEMADSVLLRHVSLGGGEEGSNRADAEEYELTLGEEEELHIFDTKYNGEVAIHGEGNAVYFHNCEFLGNVVNYAPSTTFVYIMEDCEFADGAHCVLSSGIREADIEYPIPKFVLFFPCDVEGTDLGGVLAIGDFDVHYDGRTYTVNDVTYYQCEDDSIVPYEEGMELSGHGVIRWWENGEEIDYLIGF